jgi:hypothetical protein
VIDSLISGVTAGGAVAPVAAPAVGGGGSAKGQESGGFAEILRDAAMRDGERIAAMPLGSSPSSSAMGGYGDIYGAGMEQMMMSVAASGEMTQQQIALFMMYAMTRDDGGELSMYMPMIVDALSSAGSSGRAAPVAASGSGYSGAAPVVSGGSGAVLPTAEWVPTTPAIVSSENDRSPERLRAVIDQFNVESAERYRPRRNNNDTYCNIFVWDVTAALGCEIPHYADPVTGAPMSYPNVKGAREQGAIAMEQWLETYGARYGWRETDAQTAQQYANEGRPAVTTSRSAGHTQMVCPSQSGQYDPARGVTVSQAGSRVVNYTHISGIYSQKGLTGVRYFVHD